VPTGSRRLPIAAIVVAAVILSACAADLSTNTLQGEIVDPPGPKPNFTLTDTSGATYDFGTETEGKLTLLYFGYLNCPDICPVHLAQIAETFDTIPEIARETEVVFVSVDPNRDTPEEIRAYLDNFDSRFVGLTGSLSELEAAQKAAGVPVAVFVGEGADYTVNHAAMVLAYGPDGLNHSLYPSGVRQNEWNNDLQLLAKMTRGS
jgi:protein SCO1/2